MRELSTRTSFPRSSARLAIHRKETPRAKGLTILQIVPRLPPAIDGVGDYALALASALRSTHGIQTRFMVSDPAWEGKSTIAEFTVTRLRAASAPVLKSSLSEVRVPSTIVLHYVGYGYHRQGCPFWLVKGLRGWLAEDRQRRVVTMFHELFAFGPPWRRSFWTSPFQRHLTKVLACASSACITNRKASAAILNRLRHEQQPAVKSLPVFSNFGEPSIPRQLSERQPRMAVYGRLRMGRTAPSKLGWKLTDFCREHGIKTLVTFGSHRLDSGDVGLPVQNRGHLSGQEISDLLLNCRAAYLDYFDAHLAKSGIFAAYCAHGLLPVLRTDNRSEEDGLRSGVHYRHLGEAAALNPSRQSAIAAAAGEWYQGHAIGPTSALFASMLSC